MDANLNTTQLQHTAAAGVEADIHVQRAPRPRSTADTGLGRDLLQGLLAKHLYEGGVTDLRCLIERTRLAGPILEDILQDLRSAAQVEVRGVIDAGTNT